MGDVVSFEGRPSRTGVKGCQTCKFRNDDDYFAKNVEYWKCGISGFFCKVESMPGPYNCGPEKRLWQQRPPDPPSFLKRLGDAIIARIRGSANG